MVEGPSPEAVAFVHGVVRDFPGAGAILGLELGQLSAEQLLAYYVLTHHYCRDGVVRAAASSTLTAATGWAALSDKADQIIRNVLVSDAAFAKMFDALEGEPDFVSGLLMNRLMRAELHNEILRRIEQKPVERAYLGAMRGDADALRRLAKALTLRRRPFGASTPYTRDEREEARDEVVAQIVAWLGRRRLARLADDPTAWATSSPFRAMRPDTDASWDKAAGGFLREDLGMASRQVLPLLKGALGTAPKRARRRQDALHKLTLRHRQIIDREPDRIRAEAHVDEVPDQPDAVAQLRQEIERVAQGYEPTVLRAAVAVFMGEITEGQGAYRARLALPKFQLVLRGLRTTLRRTLKSWEYPAQ